MAKKEKTDSSEQAELSYSTDQSVNCELLWKTVLIVSVKTEYTYNLYSAIPLLSIHPTEMHVCIQQMAGIICNIPKLETP